MGFFDGFGSAIVNGIAGLIGTGASAAANRATSAAVSGDNLEASKNFALYQAKINRKDWLAANARQDYLLANSARIQKQALQAAGISAANIAGEFSPVSNVNPVPSTRYNPLGYVPTNYYGDLGQSVGDMISKVSNAKLADAAAKKAAEEARGLEIENNNKQSIIDSQLGLSAAEKSYKDSLTAGQNLSNLFASTTFDNRVKFSFEQLAEIQSEIAKNWEETTLLGQKAETEPVLREQMKSQISRNLAETSNFYASAKRTLNLIQNDNALRDVYKSEKDLNEAKKLLTDAMKFSEDYRGLASKASYEANTHEYTVNWNGWTLKKFTAYDAEAQLGLSNFINSLNSGDLVKSKSELEKLDRIWDNVNGSIHAASSLGR